MVSGNGSPIPWEYKNIKDTPRTICLRDLDGPLCPNDESAVI